MRNKMFLLGFTLLALNVCADDGGGGLFRIAVGRVVEGASRGDGASGTSGRSGAAGSSWSSG